MSEMHRGVEPEDFDPREHARYAVEGNDVSQYVGVSPEYMTYSSDVDKPIVGEDTDDDDDDEQDDDEDEKDENESSQSSSNSGMPSF